jgi:hypothetical protein
LVPDDSNHRFGHCVYEIYTVFYQSNHSPTRNFQEHASATNFVLITTSLWIDLCLIFLSLRALFGPTIRPFLEVFFFAVYRQCLQFLILLPIPEGILWRYPGFPSIMNDYSLQHDFYFSAHTGVSLLCAMELIRTGKKWLEVLGFSLFAYVVFALICLRIHYTMDIFTAIFVALYIIYTSERAAGPIDRFLQSLGKKIRTATSRKKTFL